eukprot:Skav212826  [mRNA]  locus=scaffold2466:561:3704:- [translate_table: standard]
MDDHGTGSQTVPGSTVLQLSDPRQLSSLTERKTRGLRVFSWSTKHKLSIVLILLGTISVCTFVGAMYPGPRQRGHGGGGMGPTGYHDIGAATLKTPPAWSHEQSHLYSLRAWISDVILWSAATDLEVERQAAAVALQITGTARDLIREIPAGHLRDGVMEQGGHVTGLMLLCRTLAAHYAPLESEIQTRAMSELMSFSRMSGESCDSSLTRFEVLRHRAAQRGGMFMNTTALSYLLLNGLRLRPEQWERALIPTDGELPATDAAYQQLVERLRRIGRMQEGHFNPPWKQGATGDIGQYHFFPTFDQQHPIPGTGIGDHHETYYGGGAVYQPVPQQPPQHPVAPSDMPASSGLLGGVQTFASIPFEMEENQCCRCGMYYADDEFSSATDSDDGGDDSEAAQLYAHYDSDPSMLGNVLYGEYLLAKQRWRRFSGRPPRRYRKYHNNRYRHQYSQQRLQRYGRTYASFLPPNAFAAHRGPGGVQNKGGGKGGGKTKGRQNPRGKDGQPLKCHRCGATDHLIKNCPRPDASGSSGKGAMSSSALAMVSYGGGYGVGSTNQLQFYTKGIGSPSSFSGDPLNLLGSKRASSVVDDLESLQSVSSSRRRTETKSTQEQPAVDYSSNPAPRYPPPPQPAPTLQEVQSRASENTEVWTSFTTGFAVPSDDGRSQASDPGVRGVSTTNASGGRTSQWADLQALAKQKSQSMPSSPKRSQSSTRQAREERTAHQNRVREATTLQLADLLHKVPGGQPSSGYNTWWELYEHLTHDNRTVFHSARTVTNDGRIGLLVDPGAHDNLVGEHTMQLLERQLQAPSRMKRLDSQLVVSGVGKESQTAQYARSVSFGVPLNGEDTAFPSEYTAPVIPNSRLPPLLGLKSLTSKRAILDVYGKLLILPGQGGVEMRCSPGTQVIPLDVAESGHLLVPVMPDPGDPPDPTDAPPEWRGHEAAHSARRGRTVNPALATDTANWRPRLNFPTSVRECRSVSPRIYEPRQLRGNFVREGDRIRTGSMPPETTVTHMPGFGRERSRPRDERSTGATATRSTGSHAAASTRR